MKPILAAFIILLILLSSCEDEKRADKSAESKQKVDSTLQALLKPDREKVALLSMKYAIPEQRVNSIITQYRDKHDFTHRIIASVLRDESDSIKDIQYDTTFSSTIDQLSKSYGLPPQHVAALIIDFKMWTACEERSSNSY